MRYFLLIGIFISLAIAGSAFADYPRPWQMGLQEAVTPSMQRMAQLDLYVHIIIAAIVIFVLCLLCYVCVRFSKKRNPVPSKTSHNLTIEVVWTVIPVLILISIAIPSIKLLYFIDTIPQADMEIKVIGHQWYWEYEYPDHGNFSFDSMIITDDKLKPNDIRLLSVDNHVVVPVDTNVRLVLTSADVIHSWAVPAFGVKTDAIPGRVNETWFNATKPGIYYGQCSELCGIGHGFMPIAVEAKSKEDFLAWVEAAKHKFAYTTNNTIIALKD